MHLQLCLIFHLMTLNIIQFSISIPYSKLMEYFE